MEIDKKVKVSYDLRKVSKAELGVMLTMFGPWLEYVNKLPSLQDVDPLQLEVYNQLYYSYYGSHYNWRGSGNVG